MATTLSGLIDRVETLLMDSGNLVWDTATITEGIRLAVGEYSTAGETAITLDGLDGESSTTLPAIHDGMVVIGAAGYCAIARAADRAESFQLGSEAAELKGWGDARLLEFKGMLGFVFPDYLTALVGSTGSVDPAKLAAEIALLTAQAGLADSQAALVDEQAGRVTVEESLLTAQAGLASAQASLATAQAGKVTDEETLLAAQAALATAQAALADAQAGKATEEEALLTAQASLASAQASLATAQAGRVTDEESLLTAQAALADARAALLTAQAGRVTSEAALLDAQELKTDAETASIIAQEARAAAAAAKETTDEAAEVVRKSDLRRSTGSPWGTWEDSGGIEYGEGYDRE